MLARVFCKNVNRMLLALWFWKSGISFMERSRSKAHADLIKNFFSMTVKFHFAAQLKVHFAETSFQWKNHCLKGRQARCFFDTFS